MLPMPFLACKGYDEHNSEIPLSINERKVSKDKNLFLGVGNMSNIFTGYTFYDLLYCDYVSDNLVKTPDDVNSAMIHLRNFNPRF
jgi:hypothetical protein